MTTAQIRGTTAPGGQTQEGKPQVEKPSGDQAGSTQTPGMDKLRMTLGFWLSMGGLAVAALLVVFLVLNKWTDAADITSVVGLFTSVLGTLVGAFFGLQIGAQGKEKAEEKVEKAEQKVEKERQKVQALQTVASRELILEARQLNPQAFQ